MLEKRCNIAWKQAILHRLLPRRQHSNNEHYLMTDTMILKVKHFLIRAIYRDQEMFAKMARIKQICLANSLLDSPMATWLTITGTLIILYF